MSFRDDPTQNEGALSPFCTRRICSREAKNKSWKCDWSAKNSAAKKLNRYLLFLLFARINSPSGKWTLRFFPRFIPFSVSGIPYPCFIPTRRWIETFFKALRQKTLCIMTSQGLMPARNAGFNSRRPGKFNNSKWRLSKFSRAMTTKTSIPRGHQACDVIMHAVYCEC